MIKIWDTFRGDEDAEIEMPKASRRGEVWGGGIPLSIRLGGLRECCNLPQWRLGQSPG